jgi:hypothetical protein
MKKRIPHQRQHSHLGGSDGRGHLLTPVTTGTIWRARGILKRKSGQKSMAEEWTEHKKEERDMEEAKHGSLGA